MRLNITQTLQTLVNLASEVLCVLRGLIVNILQNKVLCHVAHYTLIRDEFVL